MGRHSAAADPTPASPDPGDAAPTGGPARRPTRKLVERFALAAAAAGATGAVLAWGGAAAGTSVLGAAGAGVVVLIAAQLAGTLPGPPRSGGDGHREREP